MRKKNLNVSILLSNCKQSTTSLSLLVGTTVAITMLTFNLSTLYCIFYIFYGCLCGMLDWDETDLSLNWAHSAVCCFCQALA